MAMCAKAFKHMAIILFILVMFHGGCKTPFTPSEELPIIWISASSISFTCAELGPNPTAQVLQVRNSGSQTLNYTITDDADYYDFDWLTITPDQGSSSGQAVEHTILVDKTGMNARDQVYIAKITISSPDAVNSPQTADVSLEITKERPPEIKVSPNSLSFTAREGGVANPATQTIQIKNKGQQTLNYSITDDADWLEVTPPDGSSTGTVNSHTVSVNSSGFGVGSYRGNITISDPFASNNPQTVSVTLDVAPLASENEISVSCDPISGGDATNVVVSINILGNINSISSFTLELTYDENMFNYTGYETTGTLTAGWGSGTGANKVSSGLIIIGGYGGTNAIPPGSEGTLIKIKLKVHCAGCGSSSQICIQNLDDDIINMTPNPPCVTFNYQ